MRNGHIRLFITAWETTKKLMNVKSNFSKVFKVVTYATSLGSFDEV
jgi:hypothetical protein